jgi:hypothetical protein
MELMYNHTNRSRFLCQNCNKIGALLSEIWGHEQTNFVHMAPSRGRTGNSLLCGSVKACIKVTSKHAHIRLLRDFCRQCKHVLLSSVHMAPSRGRTGNSLLCGSIKACFYSGPYTSAPSVGSASTPCFLLYTWRPPVAGPAIPYFVGA